MLLQVLYCSNSLPNMEGCHKQEQPVDSMGEFLQLSWAAMLSFRSGAVKLTSSRCLRDDCPCWGA